MSKKVQKKTKTKKATTQNRRGTVFVCFNLKLTTSGQQRQDHDVKIAKKKRKEKKRKNSLDREDKEKKLPLTTNIIMNLELVKVNHKRYM